MKKIIEIIKQRKILFGIVVFSLLCLIYIIASVSQKPTLTQLQPTSIYPPDGASPILVFPATAIIFSFETPVGLESFRVTISPQTEIDIRLGPDRKSINVSPKGRWIYNMPYTVTLSSATGEFITKTTITFKDPKENPEYFDEHPVGGI